MGPTVLLYVVVDHTHDDCYNRDIDKYVHARDVLHSFGQLTRIKRPQWNICCPYTSMSTNSLR
jgi:hypothetical protein